MDDIVDIPIIMGMPLHMIIMGMPMFIMLFIISQRSRIMSIIDALAGFIFIIMPSGIISQDIWQFIMGIMPMPMFMPMPGMPIMFGIPIMGIMPMFMPGIPIMGIMFGIPIMGIMFGIPIMGIMFGMPIMPGMPIGIMPGIPIMGIMPGIPAMLPLIGMFDIPFIVFIGIPIMFGAIIGVVLSRVLTELLLPHTSQGANIRRIRCALSSARADE